jgi:PhoH-like ATPase
MATKKKVQKIFVLDTSVILYDAGAVYNFQEHDVAIPITVLEELDSFKKGDTVINLHAREFIRDLDKLSDENLLQNWIPIGGKSQGRIRVVMDERATRDAVSAFGSNKNDHHILNVALHLTESEPNKRVVLISKDINLRLKARALNLIAEDYETVKIKDVDHLYKGKSELKIDDAALITRLYEQHAVPRSAFGIEKPFANHYFILKNHTQSALAWYNPQTDELVRVVKEAAYGIVPRNAEQTFAMHAIMNANIPLVSISGKAGTGKTLIALAAALELRQNYHQIYLARPLVPLSNKDIGYLPGDIKSKINPYMQPLWDNLSFIKNQYQQKDKEYKKIEELVENEKLNIVPLAYIRGRSFSNIIFIVDEAQNLTPHEVKTIITRAGTNTKFVFTGDIYQIDTPYLDSQSNGLSYLIDRMANNPLYAHVTLEKGERSELAEIASQLL